MNATEACPSVLGGLLWIAQHYDFLPNLGQPLAAVLCPPLAVSGRQGCVFVWVGCDGQLVVAIQSFAQREGLDVCTVRALSPLAADWRDGCSETLPLLPQRVVSAAGPELLAEAKG